MIRFLFLFVFSLVSSGITAQGFLHTSGKYIYNGAGEEVILRGIGTGNWLLMEGYMMKSAEVAGTHTGFRNKLTQTIGAELTEEFYETWLDNHFTRADVDSMKAWGFNSVRVAMHYKWFTLPIEDEPVAGQDTWFEEGFVRIDSLLDWCGDNQMYLILDLHGAPGGQGKDANISDYDPAKPSLWESAENRRKTVALWARLAERYAQEPWIGGYDLINEPNWELPGGTLLRQLYGEITNAIRAVDQNHMIIIEGNWFANDYTGLTPPWDNNMVYSFHKYWTYNTQNDISWIINLRNTWNVPTWLGESGENSNSWFTGLIALCEQNRIGWSWWPVKKAGINNVLQVPESQNYNNLISYWRFGTPVLTAEQAFEAVMEWADNHRIENCMVKRDVIDAMIRQPYTNETLPFRVYKPGEPVHAVNYDLGRSSFAYKDADSANYHLNTGSYTNWNQGWVYRNDGVDIDECSDLFAGGNGFNIRWTETGEWLQYTIDADSAAAYRLTIRSASNSAQTGIIRFTVNGTDLISPLTLPNTGSINTWTSNVVNDVIIPEGTHKIRLYFERGGSNINLFIFDNPVPVSAVPFKYIYAETTESGQEIIITLNKEITEMSAVPDDFTLKISDQQTGISSVTVVPGQPARLVLVPETPVEYGQQVKISYTGSGIMNGIQPLEHFSDMNVKNNLPRRYLLPARIEAEDFYFNNGFQLENCTDAGGGYNVGFANNGDYLDYLIKVPEAGEYQMLFRIASQYSNGIISIRASSGGSFQTYGSMNVSATGGWQNWENQNVSVNLPAGNLRLRLYSFAGEYNINWFNIAKPAGTGEIDMKNRLIVYPNPGNGIFKIDLADFAMNEVLLQVTDMAGQEVYHSALEGGLQRMDLDLSHLPSGMYIIRMLSTTKTGTARVVLMNDRI